MVSLTHNVFAYDDPGDFRRQTLEGVIAHTKQIAEDHGLQLVGATEAEVAAQFRAVVWAGTSWPTPARRAITRPTLAASKG